MPLTTDTEQNKEESGSGIQLSLTQERLCIFEQLFPKSAVHNVSIALRIDGPLDLSILESSLRYTVLRHPMLRTVFRIVDGETRQSVSLSNTTTLRVCDMSDCSPTDRRERAHQLAVEQSQRPFDLTASPLLRSFVFPIDREEYLLLFVSHKLVMDKESEELFVSELMSNYESLKTNGIPHSLEMRVSFSDIASQQRHDFQLQESEQRLQYWRNQLKGSLNSPELPTRRSPSSVRNFRSSFSCKQLSSDLSARLAKASQVEDTTLFAFLLTGFLCILYRYSGLENILVGTRTSLRNEGRWNDIGCFDTYLPTRVKFTNNLEFREVLKRVTETIEAGEQAAIPFEQILSVLNPELGASRHPVFQMTFEETSPRDKWTSYGIQATRVTSLLRFTEFDLAVSIRKGATVEVRIDYSSELFATSTIDQILEHLAVVLDRATRELEKQVSQIPILSIDEREQILVKWNDTQMDYPRQNLLHELIEAQVQRTPKSTAIQFEDRAFTYEELNGRANQLARYLQRLGIGSDTLVGVCMERSLEMVVALLAVLKAGGAYVPLDPSYPKSRLGFMLADSGLKVVVTQEPLLGIFSDFSVELVCVDRDWGGISSEDTKDKYSEVTPDNLAYVIYTSGSTGKPKGVQIPHRALVNFMESMKIQPGITEQDRLLAVTTISFDIAGLELYLPLTVGARVVIAERQTAMDGLALARHLTRDQITMMQATPVTWNLLLESGWKGKQDLKVLIGGEALTRELASRLVAMTASLWNMYGPTETTIWSTLAGVKPETETILIGRPIANTTTYILDQNLQPVPVGVVGELYIGGDGLARGYLNRPELTQERFIADPFHCGTSIYRTGDLARYMVDGSIECLGRADSQVKIRGFRIELGEIESSLATHPEVRQCAVIAQEDVPGNKRLVAYVVSHPHSTPDAKALELFLKKKLPLHMVPTDYFLLAELPLTPNGKMDRKALPVLTSSSRPKKEGFSEPRTPVEARMAALWAQVLGLERVSVTDNFFEMGGNSLLAARLFARIASEFGIELSLNSLYNSPTVEQLAAQIDAPIMKHSRHQLVPIQRQGRNSPLFWIPGGRAISVLGFRETALHLGSDQPVYGLESRLAEPGEQFEKTEKRAAEYLRLIQDVQPHGPYYLAGFCTGGLVVYEMAQQLHAQGEQVALLALVQAVLPEFPRTKYQKRRMKMQRTRYLVSSFFRFIATRAATKFIKVRHETQQEIHARVAKLMLGWIGTSSQLADQTQVDADSISNLYVPSPYTGDVDIFVAEDCFESAGIAPELDPRLGWRHLVSGTVRVHSLPGDHYTMLLGLNANQFANILSSRLAQREVLSPVL